MPRNNLHSFTCHHGVYTDNRILFFGVPVCSDVGTFAYSGSGHSV
jgi:hypothetical protein